MKKLVLIGNPNTGKTSLFNALTGLNQSTGNYPGITVDKKKGYFSIAKETFELIDLPGTYSLEPHSLDEEVVLQEILNIKEPIDAIIYISDATNLRRNLFLFSQIRDLEIPCVLLINRIDKLEKAGIEIEGSKIEAYYKCPVVFTSVTKKEGLDSLNKVLTELPNKCNYSSDFELKNKDFEKLGHLKSIKNNYWAWLVAHQKSTHKLFHKEEQIEIKQILQSVNYNSEELLKEEAVDRFSKIDILLETTVKQTTTDNTISRKIDKLLTHKYYGYLIFFGVLFFIFQAIYSWASIPMEWIDSFFGELSVWTHTSLPDNRINKLVSEALIPGIGGVVIFVPQIALLFGFISLLEQSGYMSRVVFITDRFMRRFGLNGKSIVPLISGVACAIPAIMAARNIDNAKERLITILVVPFMTCAARLPVYTILIALMIPSNTAYGFNLQGLILMFMYLLGFVSSIVASVVLHKIIKENSEANFIIELPSYQIPQLKNLLHTLISKTKSFVFDAGKIIVAVSIILWVLASFGPGKAFNNAEIIVENTQVFDESNTYDDALAAHKLEHSYLGYLGKGIEPIIQPLGYDWKIGIGIIASFAAREVFVGTMASIYSVGSKQESGKTILEKLRQAKNHTTGKPTYTFAVTLSLLIFYAFAMQCVSTIAIVKRETNSWKWPIIQTVGMTGIAYIGAFLTYTIFS
ncbi:MAG: ferrous iron transport protein B [Flavobacteriales bacterium]